MAMELPAVEPSTVPPDQRIGLSEKAAFFAANMGNVPVTVAISSFLLIFYTDIVGLDPAAVGTMFLITRIFDGFNDPFVGYCIDHLPRTRWGRFRPWLVIGGLLGALNFAAVFLGPSLAPSGKLAIAYITYLLIGITFAAMDIAKNSLMPVMTTSTKERNTLASLAGISALLGMGIVTAGMLPAVNAFADPRRGWHVTIGVTAAIVFLLSALGAWGVRERIEPKTDRKYSVRDLVTLVTGTKPVLILYGASLFMMCAFAARNGVMVFYVTYNMGNAELMGPVMLSMMGGMIAGSIVGPQTANGVEKRLLMSILFFIYGAGAGISFVLPTSVVALYAGSVLFGIGMGGTLTLSGSIRADMLDWIEWKHGYRAEGATASVGSLVAKIALAIGGALPGYVLAATDYVANAPEQSAAALRGIVLSISVVPAAFAVAAGLLFLFYPITGEDHSRVSRDLFGDDAEVDR